VSTKKVYEGEWAEGSPKCGEYRDPNEVEMFRFGSSKIRDQSFTLPPIGLEDANGVLEMSISSIRLENAVRRGVSSGIFEGEALAKAKSVFCISDVHKNGLLPIYLTEDVFDSLGINSSITDLKAVFNELDIGVNAEISFPEIVDIAMYIYTNISV